MNSTADRLRWVKSFAGGEFATVPGTEIQIHHSRIGTYLVRSHTDFLGFADTDAEAIARAHTFAELAEVCGTCDSAGTGPLCRNHRGE